MRERNFIQQTTWTSLHLGETICGENRELWIGFCSQLCSLYLPPLAEIGTYRSGVVGKFLGPFLTLWLLGVWLVILWYGELVGGIVTVSTIGPSIEAAPPYL